MGARFRQRITLVLEISTMPILLFDGTLYKVRGERIGVLPWIENFNGSALVKKCPGLAESLGSTWSRLQFY